ncbi:MAG: hypothetical protein AMXMBFR13_45480 [Phycisphaerae bacterium]
MNVHIGGGPEPAENVLFSTGGSERMRIHSAGQVTIGTATADVRPLAIRAVGSFNDLISLRNANDETRWHITLLGNGFNLAETTVAEHRIYVAPGGNVGIGTNNLPFKLTVNGEAGKPGGGSWAEIQRPPRQGEYRSHDRHTGQAVVPAWL